MLCRRKQNDLSNSRLLFLRSSTQSTFAALIAGGLYHAQFDFMQYPPIPINRLDKLKKLYDPAEAQEHLQRNLITSRKEFEEKIEQNFFDFILLLDCDASLFRYTQLGCLKKLCNLIGQSKLLFRRKLSAIAEEINYIKGIPYTLSAISAKAVLAVIDLDDWVCLSPSGQELLRVCSSYYKRELPFNRFFLYYQQRPAPWRNWRKKLAPVCTKVRHIPLGIEDKKYYALKRLRSQNQNIDIFFCGQPTSTLRIRAAEELKKLAGTANWKIVVADAMPFKEFCEHIARSKITISVSGGGWDCFRHYEAAALGSLPLMDRPTIDTCWLDIADGTFFFDSTFRNFQERLEFFLTCPERRSAALAAITQHVEQDMLHSKIVERIVAELLYEKNNHHRNNAPETAADHSC